MPTDLAEQFKLCRRTSTPLVAVRTPDARELCQRIAACFNGNAPPIFAWDIASGVSAANDAARPLLSRVAGDEPAFRTNPAEALIECASKLPERGCWTMLNAHRYLDDAAVVQAVWNLRDTYKANRRTLVMLGPDFTLPPEIAGDVLTLDDALPDGNRLAAIVRSTYADAQLDEPDDETVIRAVAATAGLTAFQAEQACALNLTPAGLDQDGVWECKRQMIEGQEGLSVYRGGDTFKDVRGYDNAKNDLVAIRNGEEPPSVILRIDEIDKQGVDDEYSGDSGVGKAMLGILLTWMSLRRVRGLMYVGPPGSGKSQMSQSAGGEFGIPTIEFSLTNMKSSLVGESEARLRACLRVVDAVGQGRILVIATANSFNSISAPLRRRFTEGIFYFDMPSRIEQLSIWELWLRKNGLSDRFTIPDDLPDDTGWSGSDIAVCATRARQRRCSLVEAAMTVVPVSVSARKMINDLRGQADGAFLSASYEGLYDKSRNEPALTGRRANPLEE